MTNHGPELRSDFSYTGYSREDKYFNDLERELREKQHQKIEEAARNRMRATQSGTMQDELNARVSTPRTGASAGIASMNGGATATRTDTDLRAEAAEKQHCPQCSAEHHPTKILGVDATECAQCHGIFLSEEQAKAVQDLSAGQASG